ncbi:MFS transporter [Ruegeria pomeroyi]|uniref:MFS transporter n=1 Tax=Ruegeria pomeroyi TaxID=89184 RepID=A0A9Q3ZP32_9RHOB|nr:MFS transporter [Ruegeria pomeroyi]
MSLELAGLSVSVVSWTVVATGTFGGWLTDRTGRPATVLLTGLGLFGLALFLFPRVPPMLITTALIGLLSGVPVAGLISLPARVLKPEQRASAWACSTPSITPVSQSCPVWAVNGPKAPEQCPPLSNLPPLSSCWRCWASLSFYPCRAGSEGDHPSRAGIVSPRCTAGRARNRSR